MISGYDSFLLWSTNYQELAKWYQEKLNLKVITQLNLPDDSDYLLSVGESKTPLWIGYHDKVHGKSKDPYRIMIGFTVTNIEQMCEELKNKGVEFEADLTISPTGDYKVATIKDPEGNIIQLFDLTPIEK